MSIITHFRIGPILYSHHYESVRDSTWIEDSNGVTLMSVDNAATVFNGAGQAIGECRVVGRIWQFYQDNTLVMSNTYGRDLLGFERDIFERIVCAK